ncbi:hypothetical protein [Halostella sp. PRR32]|uniref:hypothetical protein n=1 Tax=Halostella sp. PRR32 TaxID=3098147 RepID=UPI002B1E504E|nr:hypothetical protein [Halostella sp. PRR32]
MFVISFSVVEWAQISNGIFTPLLTGALIIVYVSIYREQQQQTQAQLLPYLPRLIISGQKIKSDSKSSSEAGGIEYIVFENTGDVPFNATVSMALESIETVDENSPLLNPDRPYKEVPDSMKVFHGGVGDWRDHVIFLNPDQRKEWPLNNFVTELRTRHASYRDEPWCWLRLDVKLESTLDHTEPHDMRRLFRVALDENSEMNALSFSEARKYHSDK